MSLGVLFISKLGGYIFHAVGKISPFVLVGAFDALFVILVIVLRLTRKFTK
jgi:hypothetical protein